MQRRHSHGRPSAARIPKRTFAAYMDEFQRPRLRYTGNQNRPGFTLHPTKGWRKAQA